MGLWELIFFGLGDLIFFGLWELIFFRLGELIQGPLGARNPKGSLGPQRRLRKARSFFFDPSLQSGSPIPG